jgi:hypothetical protein
VDLSWEPVPGAVRYRVYRSTVQPVLDFFPPEGIQVTIPAFSVDINVPGDFLAGRFDAFCDNSPPETLGNNIACAANTIFRNLELSTKWVGFPKPYTPIATVVGTSYSEPAPSSLQSMYFVVAVDENGLESPPSNVVGGPSYGVPTTAATAHFTLEEMRRNGVNARLIDRVEQTINRASLAASRKEFRRAQAELAATRTQLPDWVASLGILQTDDPEESKSAGRNFFNIFPDFLKSGFGIASGLMPGAGVPDISNQLRSSSGTITPNPMRRHTERQKELQFDNDRNLTGSEEQAFVSSELRDLMNGMSRTIRLIEDGVYPPETLGKSAEELTRRKLTRFQSENRAE